MSTLGFFAVDPVAALNFALVTHGILFLFPVVIGLPVLLSEREAFARLVSTAASLLGWTSRAVPAPPEA